jgi:ubiquinol-cytochrome c reductase iron-sulfur subunit
MDWQNKPVWILRRTQAEVAALAQHDALLTDPQSAQSHQPPACRSTHRSLRADIFIAVGVCTHLGCTPALQPGIGFLCPCHASRYDLAGRVFNQGPAPANLTIPAYHFASETRLVIGADA